MEQKDSAKKIRKFYRDIGNSGIYQMTEVDHRLEWEIPLLQSLFLKSNGKQLLDIGCGNGRIAIPLAKLGYKIDGIDLVPEFIHEAKKQAVEYKLDCEFFVKDAFDMNSWDKCYHGVFMMWGTFRHILDKQRQIDLLKVIFEMMTFNGMLVIDTIDEERLKEAPNLNNQYQKRLDYNKKSNVVAVLHKETGNKTYAFQFTEKKLFDLLDSVGFTQIRRIEVNKDLSRLVMVGVKSV